MVVQMVENLADSLVVQWAANLVVYSVVQKAEQTVGQSVDSLADLTVVHWAAQMAVRLAAC